MIARSAQQSITIAYKKVTELAGCAGGRFRNPKTIQNVPEGKLSPRICSNLGPALFNNPTLD